MVNIKTELERVSNLIVEMVENGCSEDRIRDAVEYSSVLIENNVDILRKKKELEIEDLFIEFGV